MSSMNYTTGINFLKEILANTRASITWDKFYQSLRLDRIDGTPMSDADLEDWVESLGYKVTASRTITFGTRPHETILARIKAGFTQPNMVPTRKTIDSGWLSTGYSPTFFDVAKLAAREAGTLVTNTATQAAKTAADLLQATTSTISAGATITKYLPYVLYAAIPIGAYMLWRARGSVIGAGAKAISRAASRAADKV